MGHSPHYSIIGDVMYGIDIRAYKITVDHMTNQSILDLLIKVQYLTDYTWNVREYSPRKITTVIFNIDAGFVSVMDIAPYLLIDCDIIENPDLEHALSNAMNIDLLLPDNLRSQYHNLRPKKGWWDRVFNRNNYYVNDDISTRDLIGFLNELSVHLKSCRS